MKILIIEDDLALNENIQAILEKEGYATICCADGEEGLYYIENNSCGLVILDCMLPGISGVDILKTAREKKNPVPVIMLSAMSDVKDRITGLDAGADDYLTKPFEYGELLARVRALTRRPAAIEFDELLKYEDLSYNINKRELCGPKATAQLTKTEGALLELFMRSGGAAITKSTIFNRVWGPDSDTYDSNIATYIHFLRRRILAVGSSLVLENHWGVGFSLVSK